MATDRTLTPTPLSERKHEVLVVGPGSSGKYGAECTAGDFYPKDSYDSIEEARQSPAVLTHIAEVQS